MRSSFTALDAFVLAAYLAGTTALGMWLGRNQRDARDYFVAGQRVPWWAILFSVVATETSALTFISIPGVAYIGNFTFLQVATGYLLGRIVISFTLLPRYYHGELVTAYALLERRFGVATRRFASIVFMLTRAFADSVRVFATAIPIAIIIGPLLPSAAVQPTAILLLGVLTLIYTFHGGMRAVIWTDVVQTVVYVGGGVAAIVLLSQGVPGGWGEIFARAESADKLRLFDLYLGFDRPHTLLAGLLGGAFLSMASHGADQIIVQRLLAASSLGDARRALIGSGIAVIAQFALFLTIGIGLWVFYIGREFATPDAIFPTFVVEVMPPGLTGLVVAAILAAAMSTLSGSINSLAAAATHDIWLPLTRGDASSPRTFRIGRRLSLAWGVILLAGSLLYREQGTPVVILALSIASFTYGAMLGPFFLGILWRRAVQRDAITGMVTGLVVMSLVVFARNLRPLAPAFDAQLAVLGSIAWPWYVLIGTTVTVVVGVLSSFTHGAPQASEGTLR
ncbi:MAG TPA: sodium:solute symporter [Gemmatimonadaceae bacterium]